jgi:isopentenyl-diphosphate delta-isomerase
MDLHNKQVTLVDENDQVLGQEDIYSAHSHPAKRHRAISVWLLRDSDGQREVFFQKRSSEKIVGADQWGNGVCGNVQPRETYSECAYRRLAEEIGVTKITLTQLFRFEYKVYSNQEYGEHEVDQVFIARYDGDFELNPAEVSQYQWVRLDELYSRLETIQYISAAETLSFTTTQLQEKTPALTLILNDKKNTIAPWTALMLKDDRLQTALHDF